MRILLLLILALGINHNLSAADAATEQLGTKRIALSFDDAPKGAGAMFSGAERTDALIAALRSANTGPVAFFVTTENLQKPGGKKRIRRYADAGHLIANHTHSHQWLSRTDTDEYIADIDKAELLLAGFSNRRAWMRFPYLDEGKPLAKRDAVRAALGERELMNGYVTVDNYDWYLDKKWQEAVREDRSVDMDALGRAYIDMLLVAVEFYDEIAVNTFGRSPAHVLLLHENDIAAVFIGDLVTALREKGWSIISPDEAYEDPDLAMPSTTLVNNSGRVTALAIDAGLNPRTLTHLAIEEDQIDAMLLERMVFGPVRQMLAPRSTKPKTVSSGLNNLPEQVNSNLIGPISVFQRTDEGTYTLNSSWLEGEYLPTMDFPDSHLRSTFVRVSPTGLRKLFKDLYEASGGYVHHSNSRQQAKNDIVFELFPDAAIEANLFHLSVGRHSGLITASLRTKRTDSLEMGNTDNIRIEISADGKISGIIDLPQGMYRIRPTPDPALVVISEMDSEGIYQQLRLN